MTHRLPVPGSLYPRAGLLTLAALSLAALSLAGPTAFGQQGPGLPRPHLSIVSPAGARAGTSVQVTVGGLHIEDPEKLIFSHPGLKAEFVPAPPPPLDPKTGKPKPGMPAATPGIFQFKITVPADVPLGNHDVRLVNKWGVSNPRVFAVGDLLEVAEKEPNNDAEQAQKIDINTTVNGAFASATDVDYYAFTGKKGQRVVLSCVSAGIDGRATPTVEVYDARDRQLATNRNYQGDDALTDVILPADGTYFIRLYQFTFTFRQGIPLAGALPPGMADHFYRLSVSTAPWIDAVFPPIVEPGKATTVTVWGRNLPGGKIDAAPGGTPVTVDDNVMEKITLTVTPPAAPDAVHKLAYSGYLPPPSAVVDGFELRVKNDAGSSNPFLLAFARAPVVIDNGDNDTPEKAQPVTLPCDIAGRVEKRRDRDWYSFTAKKGETWGLEVQSDRLGAPTYMAITVRNPANKGEMYESPINEPASPYARQFFARSEDPPIYKFTAPADGTYQLLVVNRAGDTSAAAGPRHTYRVRITRDEADFRLVALSSSYDTPDSVTVPAGGGDAFTVLAFREEGFAGDITLTVEGLPAGLTCPPQTINGNVRQTPLVITAGPGAAPWSGEVKIKGTAVVSGKPIVREARSGTIVWPVQAQQNIITASRLSQGLYLAVRDKAVFSLTASIDKAEVPQGDKATIKVVQDRFLPDFKTPLTVQLKLQQGQNQSADLPTNLRINNNAALTLAPTQKDGSLGVTVGPDVPPGVYNVVIRGTGQIPYAKDPMAKTKPNVNVVSLANPISLTVVPKSLATLTVSNPSPTVKAGQKTELVVKVARKYNFDGEFKVKLELPPGTAGLAAQEITIPPGQEEGKLVIEAAAGAAPGNRANLTVKATALFLGKTPTPHEAKINVNVTK